MVPTAILDLIPEKCSEGFALALAQDDDGAVIHIKWCNRAFSRITGYALGDIQEKRGTFLVGPSVDQSTHLLIIEKLMKWESFSLETLNNRKNGEQYFHRMNWIPLTDPSSGKRWWLYSITELKSAQNSSTKNHVNYDLEITLDFPQKLIKRLDFLEKENARLYQLTNIAPKESHEDSLTGLSNRRHFEIQLKSLASSLRSGGQEFAVLYVNLDRFKLVNDTLGHDVGDRLLVHVATILRQLSEATDLIARLGGDEFVMVKKITDNAIGISNLADEIVQRLREPSIFEEKSVACSASVGVAFMDAELEDPEQAMANADTALNHAKSQGRDRWAFFSSEMNIRAITAKNLSTDLLQGITERQFTVFFQPIVDARTGMIASAEVLLRWNHPSRGLLLPDEFLEIASGLGVLKRIDEISFECLKDNIHSFEEIGIYIPRFAINVSIDRLADPSLVHDIRTSGIDPKRLTVEILESVFLERIGKRVKWTLDELADLGVAIAIDDFGTGHASVKGLLEVEPSILKIDRQLVQPVVQSSRSKSLAKSIIGIGKSLGMSVVAEGVESREHAVLLGGMGCDFLQGAYLGSSMSATDLSAVLVSNQGKFSEPLPRVGEPSTVEQ